MKMLRRNYQRISTNRFIVDSPRFWRPEFNPRFKDIFKVVDFKTVLADANVHMSFKFDDDFVATVSTKIFEYFKGFRFVCPVDKNPETPKMFLADMYFAFLDTLGQLTFKDFPLDEDDFNLVSKKAETGKNDFTKVATDEHNNQTGRNLSAKDMLSHSLLSQINTNSVENVDEETEQNSKTVNDVFLSPQDTGNKPNNESIKHKGVDGIKLVPDDNFMTNKANQLYGDSIKNKTNTSDASNQLQNDLSQHNDVKTLNETTHILGMNQEQENTMAKNDNYMETLDFDRAKRLKEYYDLSASRLWFEILAKLSRWILQANIATGDTNYLNCRYYE